MEQNRACALARDKRNMTCFAGGDQSHRDEAVSAWNGIARCENLVGL